MKKVNGIIKISDEIYTNDGYKDVIKFLFTKILPLYIEFRYWENNIWYVHAFSESFDNLKEGDAVPQYDVIVTETDKHDISIEFNKI